MAKKSGSEAQQIKDLTREILTLPERERIELFKELRRDVGDAVAPSPVEAENERRAEALAAFNRVAEHLGLDDDGKRTLTMSQFDAVPDRVRDGWRARRVAAAYFDSWLLVKEVALGARLPVRPESQRERRKLGKEARRKARYLTGLIEWLDTDPKDLSRGAYDHWRAKRNANLAQGQLPVVNAKTIHRNTKGEWPEIVAAARRGELEPPGATDPDHRQFAHLGLQGDLEPSGQDLSKIELADPDDLSFNFDLLARRLRQAREARGWTQAEASTKANLHKVIISKIERGAVGQPRFEAMVLYAKALGVSLDFFATDDGKKGLPPKLGMDPKTKARHTATAKARRRKADRERQREIRARKKREAEGG